MSAAGIVCDLVLLSWNHLEETQPCLESLFTHTDVPTRLFIVDNGSELPVRRFLQTIQPHGAIQEVRVLQHETNEGFPRGMNRGIRTSSAPYVCLLNNDLLFSPGWLSRMLEVAEVHPEIGVLNPASNTFGQRPPPGKSLDAYAAALEAKRGLYVEVGMCIGFCLLIKRGVIEQIGPLSEEVERIFFEDEDYAIRAQRAGFQCVVVESAYVHHAEHRTVKRMAERERIFQRNKTWCEQRWGRWLRVAYPSFHEVRPGSDELYHLLRRLVGWARNRTHVYVYCPTPAHLAKNDLFRSVGLVPHADVLWYPISVVGARWAAAGAIVKRQKKRFDAIIAPDDRWAAAMRRLRWIHRAQVIPSSDTNGLSQLWQARFPSPS